MKYNKALAIEIEKARQEKIQVTLIKDIVKGRMADIIFEVQLADTKVEYLKNKLKNERENCNSLRTMISFGKEEMKNL